MATRNQTAEPRCSVDYLELRRDDDLGPLPDGPADTGRLLVAARFGSTRLIDNDTLTGPE